MSDVWTAVDFGAITLIVIGTFGVLFGNKP